MQTIVNELVNAERRLANLARENAQLRQHANRMRRRLAPGRSERIVRNAAEDAKLILHLRHSGLRVSRRWLDETGMVSAFRYGWALGFLRACRLERTMPESLQHLSQCLHRVELITTRYVKNNELLTLRIRSGKRYQKNRYA